MKNPLIKRLAYANAWRRGADTKMPDPKQLGIDIDEAIEIIKRGDKISQDDYMRFELLDRAHTLCAMIDTLIIDHDGIELCEAGDQVEALASAASNLYQLVGTATL